MTKSKEQAGKGDGDMMANIARTVGSALGTVVAKVSKTQKAVRPKRSRTKAQSREAHQNSRQAQGNVKTPQVTSLPVF